MKHIDKYLKSVRIFTPKALFCVVSLIKMHLLSDVAILNDFTTSTIRVLATL
ncbi:hypothetical protein ACFSR2_11545 [Emticicia soli]|uniref:Uncharacterized protein n=1 Tax=Emticicia soli TaxID=2027878 RepID=A0ABW5J9W8_9BACT